MIRFPHVNNRTMNTARDGLSHDVQCDRVSLPGCVMSPDADNTELMKRGEPEHAAPPWLRITCARPNGTNVGANVVITGITGVKTKVKRVSPHAKPVYYTINGVRTRFDTINDCATAAGCNKSTIANAITLPDGRVRLTGGLAEFAED